MKTTLLFCSLKPSEKFRNHPLSDSTSWKKYEVNTEVAIIYDPKQPTNLIIAKIALAGGGLSLFDVPEGKYFKWLAPVFFVLSFVFFLRKI